MLTELSNKELVSELVEKDSQRANLVKEINKYKAELMKRGIAVLDDTNTKFIKFYSDNGSCSVTDAEKLVVIDDGRLKKLLPEGIYDKFVTITQKVDYKYDSKFEQAMKSIFNGDYTFEMSLEEFLDTAETINLDAKQKKILLKKLKGDYEKDKETLESVLGDGDYDVELYYINRIKNAELIRRFLPDECLDIQMEEIRKCMIVESSTKVTIEANDMEE